jgi:hypothetical protein
MLALTEIQMPVDAKLVVEFQDNKAAQDFSGWLYQSGYANKTLFQSTVTVNLLSHGDRVVVMEEARRRRGTIVEDDVRDDY